MGNAKPKQTKGFRGNILFSLPTHYEIEGLSHREKPDFGAEPESGDFRSVKIDISERTFVGEGRQAQLREQACSSAPAPPEFGCCLSPQRL